MDVHIINVKGSPTILIIYLFILSHLTCLQVSAINFCEWAITHVAISKTIRLHRAPHPTHALYLGVVKLVCSRPPFPLLKRLNHIELNPATCRITICAMRSPRAMVKCRYCNSSRKQTPRPGNPNQSARPGYRDVVFVAEAGAGQQHCGVVRVFESVQAVKSNPAEPSQHRGSFYAQRKPRVGPRLLS